MIESLRLQNFRSYADKKLKFIPEANIIVGPNAIGKTNVIEAILVTQVGSSYRAKDNELIAFSKSWSRLDAEDENSLRVVKLRRDGLPAKSFDINGQLYKRLPAQLKLPVVLFEPNHLQLLNGAPEARRSYLDTISEQTESEYGPLLRKYNRALAQRNSLLKSLNRPSASQLFPWNLRISQLAGQIVAIHAKTINNLNNLLPKIYNELSKDKVKTAIIYKTQLPITGYESGYFKTLESNIEDDLRAGFTLIGPHRDDFIFTYNKHPSANYASRGEIRTAVLALKIAELKNIELSKEIKPIILLDDVYSELDSVRRKALTTYLKDNQSFITTTNADVVKKDIKTKTNIIELR